MNEFKTNVQGTKDIYTIEYRTNSRANYEEAQELLRKFVDNKPKTNFDRINNMTIEEAAHELTGLFYKVAQYSNAEHYIRNWLQKEADDGI